MKTLALILVAFLAQSQAYADVLVNSQKGVCANSADCSITGVSLMGAATATVENRSSNVKMLGAGLRLKKVAIAKVRVYVAELMGSDPTHFVRTPSGALASLASQSTIVMTLQFLRDVDAGQVQSSFQDALAANSVDQNQTQIVTFLDSVSKGGTAKSGKAYTIVGEKLANGVEVVTYQGTDGNAVPIHGGAGFVSQVMSIWLGTPSDHELGDTKNDILRDRGVSVQSSAE